MQEHYYVGAYWGPRQETVQECAQRVGHFLHMLARCDPSFIHWYQAGRGIPRELPGHPVGTDLKSLEDFLLRGRRRTDVSKKVIEDMGFGQMVWNAKKERTYISMTCGGYSPWGVPNSCILNPTPEKPIRERLLRNSVLTEVLTSMATAWDPDFAMASSSEMVALIEKGDFEVRVGWLTYLSRKLGRLPPLPAPVRIESVGELGWLLTLAPEPMTASNPEHVAFITRVRELLDRAGLIERPRPKPAGQ